MYQLKRRLNLTLPGLGGGGVADYAQSVRAAAPPPPPASAPGATGASSIASRASVGGGQATPANVRNTGGARGLDVMGTTTRALKSLTGQ
jgi:hypothetical protein